MWCALLLQGGVDPRLWTAIVAVNTYSLPVYTYDLSPWLGVLNNNTSSGSGHTITVELFGASGSDWALASMLMLWRSETGIEVLGRKPMLVESASMAVPVVSACEGKQLDVAGKCVVRLGERSMVAGSLLKIGDTEYAAFVKYDMQGYENTIAYNNSDGGSSWRQVTLHEASWFMGHLEYQPRPMETSHKFGTVADSGLRYSGILGQVLHAHASTHDSTSALTRAHTRFSWLNAGGIADGATFEFSDNLTVVEPHLYGSFSLRRGRPSAALKSNGHQRHYQRLTMLDVYNISKPACIVLAYPTHTVTLNTSVNEGMQTRACVQWQASCAFCSPELMVDEYKVFVDIDKC
jgi:hypothetical protein